MYKHILLAVDGSELARHAAEEGLDLAKTVGAKASAIMVTMPWSTIMVGEVTTAIPPNDYEERARASAERVLAEVSAAARSRDVACAVLQRSDSQPWHAITEVAKERGCDLIVVGSHGRSGLSRLLIGSQAIKVLTHSKLPVLVHRE